MITKLRGSTDLFSGSCGFGPTWRRVTVASLTAPGQVAPMPYHLGRAMDNGLTRGQAGEVISRIAFYAGWPNGFSALPVAKSVFDARTK